MSGWPIEWEFVSAWRSDPKQGLLSLSYNVTQAHIIMEQGEVQSQAKALHDCLIEHPEVFYITCRVRQYPRVSRRVVEIDILLHQKRTQEELKALEEDANREMGIDRSWK